MAAVSASAYQLVTGFLLLLAPVSKFLQQQQQQSSNFTAEYCYTSLDQQTVCNGETGQNAVARVLLDLTACPQPKQGQALWSRW
jgi:hypothetical protein